MDPESGLCSAALKDAPMPLDLFMTDRGSGPVCLLVLPRAKEAPSLLPHAIVGEAPASSGTPQLPKTKRNATFVRFYLMYMRGQLGERPEILANGRAKPGEHVYVIDPRSATPKGNVPWTDIVGWYKSDGTGAPIPGTFEYNAEHAVVSPQGAMTKIADDPRLQAAALQFR